ncbi:MAG: hypothetical protein AABZ39_05270 [Spirochaetota bacterium]
MNYVMKIALISLLSAALFAEDILPLSVRVGETTVIKRADPALLGFGTSLIGGWFLLTPGTTEIRTKVYAALKDFPTPLIRLEGTMSQVWNWKKAVGPLESRPEHRIEPWERPGTKRAFGPVEWVTFAKRLNPGVKLVWDINMRESAEDAADLAEFLCGDGQSNPNGGVNWAQKRIECGLAEPVEIFVWELGNELDGSEFWKEFDTIRKYTDKCKAVIHAIKGVLPNARFAPFAATLNQGFDFYKRVYGGTWEIWHRTVLRDLVAEMDSIDYVMLHPYFGGVGTLYQKTWDMDIIPAIAADIREITGSDRIKIFLSEYAFWPPYEDPAEKWDAFFYKSHALVGCLQNAEWLNRMLARKEVSIAALHNLGGTFTSPWGIIYPDRRDYGSDPEYYLTGIAPMMRMFNSMLANNGNSVRVELEGEQTDKTSRRCLVTAAAVALDESIFLSLVNRDPDVARNVAFSAEKTYALSSETILTADDIDAYNTMTNRPLKSVIHRANDIKPFSNYLLGARSFVVLHLVKK